MSFPLNPLRIGTPDDIADAQRAASAFIDTNNDAPSPYIVYGMPDVYDHWRQAGHDFVTGVLLHAAYTNRDAEASLAFINGDPLKITDNIRRMGLTNHDPEQRYGWVTEQGQATSVHPEVARAITQILDRPTSQLQSVLCSIRTHFLYHGFRI